MIGETKESLILVGLVSNLLPAFGGHVRTAGGDNDLSGINGRRSGWFSCVGVIEGETVGLSIIDHPDNLTYPTGWRLSESGQLLVSPFETCSVSLMAFETITLRFRFQTYGGYVYDGWTAERAREFASEPIRM